MSTAADLDTLGRGLTLLTPWLEPAEAGVLLLEALSRTTNAVAVRLLVLDLEAVGYADVAANSTFYLWINQLTTAGAINGYACGGTGEPCCGEDHSDDGGGD